MNYVCFRDYETGSKNRHTCQPLQLAAVMIDVDRLEIVDGSLFQSLIKPVEDSEELQKLGWGELEEEAMNKHGLDIDDLRKAPNARVVWNQYVEYLKKYNKKGVNGGTWNAPIVGGFNNVNFDDFIDRRLCSLYGPDFDEYGAMTIYHPFMNFDLQRTIEQFFAYVKLNNSNSVSMDTCREFFGISTEMAHNAKKDVLDGAFLFIKFLRLYKGLTHGLIDLPKGKRIKFKNSFANENRIISGLL